jgi:hypothetical protein
MNIFTNKNKFKNCLIHLLSLPIIMPLYGEHFYKFHKFFLTVYSMCGVIRAENLPPIER